MFDNGSLRGGMHRAYYSAIERGERNGTLTTVAGVADGLDMLIAALMAEAEH